MKILRVIASMDPSNGGPCQGIRYSIPELEKLGVSNEVVCLDDPAAPFCSADPFPVQALGEGRGPWQYSGKLGPWLMQHLHRFDVVIVHGLWLYHSFAVNRALNHFKKLNHSCSPKLFIMPHGMLDPYFQRAAGRKIKALRNWLYWKLIEGNVVNGADGVLFTCEQELKLAQLPFRPYSPAKELNVGYGIAEPPKSSETILKAFYRLIPGLRNQKFLLFISRIHEKKGVDMLIEAYAEIWKRHLNPLDTHTAKPPLLVIAGPGLNSDFGKKIRNSAASIIPKNAVFFSGMLSGDEKWGAFYSCEAFILPSHQENFGIAVVEALGCGKPVLITDQINIYREIIRQEAGIIAKDNLAGTIKLLDDWISLSPREKTTMGDKAFDCFLKYFSLSQNARKLLSALQ
ncbi:glycosyltransferase [Litoribacter ruber]|uniref:glycosyltransferase n=1 Tax=Litoribacter ruber TaxID=702568 RepID=UPI001BD9AD40|nr:glycosyltransferase [Litoribacter ruber]MBT0812291.1 glycosyltransferase [Litoribacter ruber]